MRRLFTLFLVLLCTSIGAWASDGSNEDGYWLSFDSWYQGNSFAEIVTKINVSKPGGLAKAVKAINDEVYSTTHSVTKSSDPSDLLTATYKTAKVVYIRCSGGYFNSDDLAALSDLGFETIDLQDAFYKESAEGEKKAFTFTNASVKNLILPDGWTKEEVNKCAKAVAETSGSQLGSAYSQGVEGMTETKDITRYYFDNEGVKGSEYTGGEQYQEGENWYANVNNPVTRNLTKFPDEESYIIQTYTNSWNDNAVETVSDATAVYEEYGNKYIKPNPLNVKLTRYLYNGSNQDQSNNETLGHDETGYYIMVYDNNATTQVYQKRTTIYKNESNEYYYDAEFTNRYWGTPQGNEIDGYYNIDGYFLDQEFTQQTYNSVTDNGDGTYSIQGGNVKQYLTETYKYQDQSNWQEVVYTGATPTDNGDGTYTGSIENTTVAFQVTTKYNYSYLGLDGEATGCVTLDQEQTQIQLDNYVKTALIAETNPETTVLGASLVAYVNKSNTLYDAMQHCFIDEKGNTKIGNISRYGEQQYSKIKALTISGNAVARDWANVKSLEFTNGHLVFDLPADELNKAPYGAADGKTRAPEGTADYGAMYGATVLYLDLSSVVMDDEYCDDLVLSKLNILSNGIVEVWIPAEGSGLKTIPADFGTNAIKEICIPSNIETIRTRAFPSCDHIWTTAAASDVKETWEDEYTKYDNGAVSEYTSDGKVSELHYITNPTSEEHYGFNTNREAYTYGTYTFGSNLKLIESNAFSNTRPRVKDVYVLNTTAPECHVDAFNTVMYYGNNGYDPGLISSEGIVTRDAYSNNGFWITMLHYPKQTKAPDLQRYTDPTRQYSIATADKDGNGATIYYPNHSEFGYAYSQGTTGYVWNAWSTEREGWGNAMKTTGFVTDGWDSTVQTTANTKYAGAESLGQENWNLSSFYDVTAGGTLTPNPAPTTWSTVYWSETAYKLADSQVNSTYDQLYDKDYRGWHQFVLNGYSANTTQEVIFERSYIKDSDWWTICLPYDLTYSEMIKFFGTETNLPILSRLLYVTRDVANEKITLNFSKNLMLYKDNMKQTADGIEDVSNVEGSVQPTDVVLHKGVPYVIKPYIPTSGDSELASRRFAIYKASEEGLYEKLEEANNLGGEALIELVENGLYTVPALVINNTGDNKEAVVEGKTVTIGGTDYGVSSKFKYTMVGSLFNNLLPSYSYYLGWKWDNAEKTEGHACFWYNRKTGEDNNKFAWTNNTCIICPNWPENLGVHKATSTSDPARWIVGGDSNTVANDDYVEGSQGARSNDILFDWETPASSGTTGIKDVDAEKTAEKTSGSCQKVYDLNGRFVSNNATGLSKGVYIVNGKKVVK